jgi:hypothetical protein
MKVFEVVTRARHGATYRRKIGAVEQKNLHLITVSATCGYCDGGGTFFPFFFRSLHDYRKIPTYCARLP